MAQPNTAKVVSQTTSRTAVGSWITGSSEPHAAIKVFSDAHLIGEVAAAASGEWSLALLNNFKGNHHELRAYGPHGHPVSCAHIQSHPHNGHASQSNPAAPSIAGISDVTRSSANPFHPASTVGNSLPTLIGFGHAGDVIAVFDGKTQIGSTAVHADGTWVFSTPTLSNGQHDFSVSTANGLSSNHLAVRVRSETSDAPSAVATITSALDEFIDPAGNHHDNVIQNGGKTFDTSPKLLGTLDATLHAGETLVVYRDGVKLGIADVSGLGWSFQDTAVAAGEHVYTARAETAAGARGSISGDFTINETGPTFSSDIPVLATENFLIFDTRGVSRTASDGSTISFDLLEGVKALEKAGMTVKSYTDSDGFISIEVDWQAYEKAHRSLNFDLYRLTSHRHVDNDKGGLDYYLKIDTALGYSTNTLDKWIQPMPWADAGIEQPATPPAASFITGIYDVYTDAAGNPAQSLIPEGGVTVALLHKITFTFSEPLPQGAWVGDGYEIYRDGVRLQPDSDILEYKYDRVTNIGWVIETNVPPGPHVYTMQVPRKFGEQGAWSEPYSIVEAAPASLAVATITSALDEFIDPSGIHHDQTISAGGKTADPSPQLLGTLDATLHAGETLVVYRDGVKLGIADVSGLGWSFQDTAVAAGEHVYTARAETAAGARGSVSGDFTINETGPTFSSDIPVLATENFLIFDTRGVSRTASDGSTISFDLLEGVKALEKAGMTVKSYTDSDGFISIEVDWQAYEKAHRDLNFDLYRLTSHRHVDNDKGGLDYYLKIDTALGYSTNTLDKWIQPIPWADAGIEQPATPPAASFITGIYDVYTDAAGNPAQSLIPEGGVTVALLHKITFTFSEPLSQAAWVGDGYEIYRDGVRLQPDSDILEYKYDRVTNIGWVIETNVPPGPHVYTMQVPRKFGEQGAWSEPYSIVEAAPASLAVATITSALDEFIDPNGIHHDQTISAGGKTADPSPQLHGTLSAALHEGEVLAIYRDGQKIGTASITGLAWSYQDDGLTKGQHVYTASVVSGTGEQGAHSVDFILTEMAGTNSRSFEILATEDFLIFDTRLIPRTTSDGKPVSFDLLEGVKMLENAGMTVKSYTDAGGIISIEVDWVAYAKVHPGAYFDLVSHSHIDNDKGGLNSYIPITVPDFSILLTRLGTWTATSYSADGGQQSSTPAAEATINGVFDSYVDADGHAQLSLVPTGGASGESTHRIEGTLSDPMRLGSDWLVIYRDGVKLEGDNHSFNVGAKDSNITWWIIDSDAPPGTHVYTARVERLYGDQGAWSEAYSIVETAPASLAVATITGALDEFIDPSGIHHDQTISAGGKTADPSPQLHGTLSAALHEGEVLAIHRDGKQIGTASVAGLGWSYQDEGLTSGQHVYTASVVSASGEQGVHSGEFAITEKAGTNSSGLKILATEDFLIFDTRFDARATSDGKSISVDMLEGVRMLEKAGMTVKSYTDNGGIISIEVDWVAYTKAQPGPAYLDLDLHRHIDNDQGGIDYYNLIAVPDFPILLNLLGKWIPGNFVIDASGQSPTPAATATITGVFDSYVDAEGHAQLSLIPAGKVSSDSTHRIEGTLSEPMSKWSDSLVIYRDGEKLTGDPHSFDPLSNQSNTTWWIIDNDVPPGPHIYTARVEREFEAQGAWSESYGIVETASAVMAVATITSALDEFIDPNGIHHDQTISAGGKTADPSPQLHGTLSAALHEGEALAIHRDGKQIGTASVTGLGWSYQDEGLTSGQHVYTASVVSASGEEGEHSREFVLVETAGTRFGSFQFLATEEFLIFDTRFEDKTTSDGKIISVDMLESVRTLEKAGMTVKSYTNDDGVISIEVDWVAYAKNSLGAYLDLTVHRHIDNDRNGIDYYNLIALPEFPVLLNLLGKWYPTYFVPDAGGQSPTPAATATITGVFDSYVDAEGHAQLSLIPAGGVSSDSTHRIEGTLSEPMSKWSDSLVIYRDGEKLTGDPHSFDPLSNQSNTTWWIIDNDVPPGPHIYTARVERAVEAQGPWSESYGIQEIARESIQDALTARMLLNDNLLVVDTGILNHTNADGSIASIQLTAELTLAGGTIAAFHAIVDGKGTGSFEADWVRLLAANPDGKLTITAHDYVSLSDQILDIHTVGTLSAQIGHWLTATPDGESAIFFNPADRSVQIHGGTGVNTITVTDDHQTIDLASLTGKTIGSTVMGIERIDLGGQHNTLKIAMIDVLNLGETDLFRADGKHQLMVNGKNVDAVELSNTRVAGIADGDWELQGNAKIGGVAYYVYEHSTAHVELMVQQGVQLSMH